MHSEYKNIKNLDLVKNIKNHYKNQVKFFLICLLALFFASQSYLCLIIDCVGFVGLIIKMFSY